MNSQFPIFISMGVAVVIAVALITLKAPSPLPIEPERSDAIAPTYAGIWVIGDVDGGGSGFVFKANGEAAFVAICIGGVGHWTYDAEANRVLVDLDDGDGTQTHYSLSPKDENTLEVEVPEMSNWTLNRHPDSKKLLEAVIK